MDWIQDTPGYKNFYFWILLATIPGFIVAALVKIDPGVRKNHSMHQKRTAAPRIADVQKRRKV